VGRLLAVRLIALVPTRDPAAVAGQPACDLT
jgi:hypothetical protein